IECDMEQIAKNCRETVLTVHPTAEITIHNLIPENVHVLADPSLMELAMLNLMENAAKYSTPPAHITVILKEQGPWVEISVADKGIGIPAEDLEHIFEKFYTVDKAHSQKLGGSGLGLSIVKTIIDKHFGKISVVSELGKGTTFTLLLPSR